MRVSNRFLYDQLVKDIGTNTEKMFKLNSQISSGKRIERPSDDPVSMSSVLVYRTENTEMGQFKKSIDLATGWLNRNDAIFADIDDALGRAIELATQQASATSTAETRAGAATEVEELRKMVLGFANSKYGNKFIFGGTQTQNQPFLWVDAQKNVAEVGTLAAAPPAGPTAGDRYIDTDDNHIYQYSGAAWVDQTASGPAEGTSALVSDQSEMHVFSDGQWQKQYQGNSDSFSIKIGKIDSIEANIPGDEVFQNSAGNVFSSLLELEKALRNNDQDGIRDQLPALNNASQSLSNNLASVGARTNRLEYTMSVLNKASVDTQGRISLLEDLDYAAAITDLTNQETIFQATLKSASMITQLSLVDYV